MTDFLQTSISGLMAFQRALDTTSHNISNVNTPGYSRQTAELMSRQASPQGSGWIGNGVEVSTIKRNYDDFLSNQTRSSSSAYNQSTTFANQAGRINNLFGDSNTGMTASLQKFTNALQAVADTPTSVPARQTLLSEATALQERLKSYDTSLRNFDRQTNTALTSEATSITTLARSIAKLNADIANGYARTGQPPNDLLDARDQLIDELATHVNVNVTKQDNNSVSVFIGNGQPLVVGQVAATLTAINDPFDASRKSIALQTPSGTVDITSSLSGGSVGGLLEFRTQVLDPARNSLGQFAVGLQDVMNAQHHAGMDLNGALGGDFFTTGDVLVQDAGTNTGGASLAVTRAAGGTGDLTNADYILTSNAGVWSLRRTDTGAAVPMTGDGSALTPFEADGISIVVSGTAPADGDRFLIRPTSDAVQDMDVLITDPNRIAVAAPIATRVTVGNTGTGKISAGEVLDYTNGALRNNATITFTSATTYTVSGDATVYTYTAGNNIDANGWRVQISGAPATGDTFTVSDNVNGKGDNRNALKLAQVLNEPVLSSGSTSLSSAVGQFVGRIGVQTNQAQVSADAQKVVYDEGVGAMQAVSGVNLDEEAANLVRYQQAYMAAAQMIRVADTVFQSVLQAVNG